MKYIFLVLIFFSSLIQAEVEELKSDEPYHATENTINNFHFIVLSGSEASVSHFLFTSPEWFSVNSVDFKGNSALHLAIVSKNLSMQKHLIQNEKANVEIRNKEGKTPLHIAVEFYEDNEVSKELIKTLLKNGANLEARTRIGLTPLELAFWMNNNKAFDFLISQGADIYTHSRFTSHTLLHRAAVKSAIPKIKLLLDHDLDINARDEHGNTPLHLAIMTDQIEAALYLIKKGADIFIKNKHGQNVFNLFKEKRSLLQKIKPYFFLNIFGLDSFILAKTIKKGDVRNLNKLLRWDRYHKIVINEKGQTGLHYATELGNKNMIKAYARAKQGNINKRDYLGNTALHYAVLKSDLEIVNLLIELNADPKLKNAFGKTPIMLAKNRAEILSSMLNDKSSCQKYFLTR